ncbi:Ribokinase [Commensalibacter sp. Nvir]|uniref:ribokinase n=1 Tax=Commensalibacter sp. Nvir TaxID=3069817 RepID=UPI002D2F0E38|nr:Ribokinase [Commensalibacter sp. Nvir]
MNTILIIGSLNIDLATDIDIFPEAGETLLGGPLEISCGGKGNNQAIAASRLGSKVSILGAIGADNFGKILIENLLNNQINIDHLIIRNNVPTATALITRTPQDNRIVVTQGANNTLKPEDIIHAYKCIAKHDIILLQQEIPLETQYKAIEIAYELGKTIVVNPAPKRKISPSILKKINYLLPNEHEIFSLAQTKSECFENIILSSSVPIIMTWGQKGVLYKSKDGTITHIPAYSVPIIDTTGAGDAFCGAFCSFNSLGVEAAIHKALQVSALAVTRRGAQNGMPTLRQLEMHPFFR